MSDTPPPIPPPLPHYPAEYKAPSAEERAAEEIRFLRAIVPTMRELGVQSYAGIGLTDGSQGMMRDLLETLQDQFPPKPRAPVVPMRRVLQDDVAEERARQGHGNPLIRCDGCGKEKVVRFWSKTVELVKHPLCAHALLCAQCWPSSDPLPLLGYGRDEA